jgi:hypothetical protein
VIIARKEEENKEISISLGNTQGWRFIAFRGNADRGGKNHSQDCRN